MPSANKTPVIGLSQWQGNEYIKRQDLNEDNLKIDNKIKDLQEEIGNIQVPVTKVNGRTGEVVLTAADLGAETPSGAQSKVKVHEDKLDPHPQYALDSDLTSLSETVELQLGELETEIESLNTDKTNKNDYVANNAFAVTTGTATAYTVTLSPVPAAYLDGMTITILPHVDCGANPTLNINALGALTILKQDGSAIASGDIKTNKPLSLVRVGSNFFVRSSSSKGAAWRIPSSIPSPNGSTFYKFLYGFDAIIKEDVSGYYQFSIVSSTGLKLTRKFYTFTDTLLETIDVAISLTSTGGNLKHDGKYIYVFGTTNSNNSVCLVYELNLNLIFSITYSTNNTHYMGQACCDIKTCNISFYNSNYLYVYNNGTKLKEKNIGTITYSFAKFISSTLIVYSSGTSLIFWDTNTNMIVGNTIGNSAAVGNMLNYINMEVV
ncbi:hypothetical protein [Clostridium sp.]|uniref:hypothetical protein n=1 Tax=Clostridium sp. TaxID=1506 RepID=UPI002FC84269